MLEEVLIAIRKKLSRTDSLLEKKLYTCVLENWDSIAPKILEAILNHGFEKLTIPISCINVSKNYWIYLRFRLYDNGEWDLNNVIISERSGWAYKWMIIVDRQKVKLVKAVRKIRKETVA